MTPCEKLGYKVGDRFIALDDNELIGRSKGDILELVEDDGSNCPVFKNITTGKDLTVCTLHRITLLRSYEASLKTGDTIERDGKKYRVTLEEIPQYDFKPGMLCRVVWDGADSACPMHSDCTRVIYVGNRIAGNEYIAYSCTNGYLAIGYVNTSNLRPE